MLLEEVFQLSDTGMNSHGEIVKKTPTGDVWLLSSDGTRFQRVNDISILSSSYIPLFTPKHSCLSPVHLVNSDYCFIMNDTTKIFKFIDGQIHIFTNGAWKPYALYLNTFLNATATIVVAPTTLTCKDMPLWMPFKTFWGGSINAVVKLPGQVRYYNNGHLVTGCETLRFHSQKVLSVFHNGRWIDVDKYQGLLACVQ